MTESETETESEVPPVGRWSLRGRAALVWIVPLLVALAILLPPDTAPARGLDPSYRWALHVAHAQGLEWGTDLLYTYGPLGYLYAWQFHPETFGAVVVAWVIFSLVFVATGIQVARALFERQWQGATWLCGLTLLTSTDAHVLFLLYAVSRNSAHRRPRWLRIAQILTLAGLGLCKHNFLALGLGMFGLFALRGLLLGRKPPWELGGYAASVLALWLLSGQSLLAAPGYLVGSFDLARGFASAMAFAPDADWPVFEVLGYAATAALLVGLVVWREWGRGRARAFVSATCLALVLFVAFKEGFTRHDAHAFYATATLLCAWILHAPRLLRGSPSRAMRIVVVVGLCLVAVNAWEPYRRYRYQKLPAYLLTQVTSLPSRLGAVIGLATGERRARLEQAYADSVARITSEVPLPPMGEGSVDLVSNDCAVVFAHGLTWNPRPVFQSFQAYTLRLAQLNAAHLRSPQGPDWVILELEAIDARFPTLADPLSWLELLTRFEVYAMTTRVVVLRRSEEARPFELEPIDAREVSFGDWVELPNSNAPLWAQVEVTSTVVGGLRALAYKPPRVFMHVRTRDGVERVYRYLPNVGEVGFLLSPVVATHQEFSALTRRDWAQALAGRSVRAIRFETEGPHSHGASIGVRFLSLRFERSAQGD